MTSIIEILVVGLVLCADSFSAAIALGSRPHKFSDTLKFAFSSGGAEALVSFLGAVAGAKIISEFDLIDHWVSFLLLLAVAIHMAIEGISELRGKFKEEDRPRQFHSFLKIIIVSFATSLDALAVGVSLGVTGKPLLPFITSIGLWAFFSTILGMSIAKVASKKLGPLFNLIGSFVLITLAFKFLIEGL
jgi:putative Mn2+ efflux pump MntP